MVIYVGVSGGADSVGLLRALHSVSISNSQRERGSWVGKLPCLDIQVVHFDHQQRGNESDHDRLFVQNLCEELQLPLHCFFWNETDSTGDSFSQDSARRWRQTRFESFVSPLRNVLVLTAHHRDDSHESQLLKLLRGTHITNLQGMETVQYIRNVCYGRPLLQVSKDDILSYLTVNNWIWREDQSNQSSKYLRNRIRNELMPLLHDLTDGLIDKRLEMLSRQSMQVRRDIQNRADHFLLETESHHLFKLPASLPLELVHEEAIHIWFQEISTICIRYDQLQTIVAQINNHPGKREWRFSLGDGHNIVREGDILRHESIVTNPSAYVEKDLKWNFGSDPSSDIILSLPKSLCNQATRLVLTTPQVCGNLPFNPPWRQGRSPIKVMDVLRGQKVPLHQRRRSPIICVITSENKRQVAAVYNSKDEKWIIDASFTYTSSLSPSSPSMDENVILSIHSDSLKF